MVDSNITLNDIFHALSDPTRRGMLAALKASEQSIGDLAKPYDMSLWGASKHIKVLEDCGLVRREKRGRTTYCSLESAPLRQARDWFDAYADFWHDRLDALEQALLADENETKEL